MPLARPVLRLLPTRKSFTKYQRKLSEVAITPASRGAPYVHCRFSWVFSMLFQVKLLLEEAEKTRKAEEAASHLLNVSDGILRHESEQHPPYLSRDSFSCYRLDECMTRTSKVGAYNQFHVQYLTSSNVHLEQQLFIGCSRHRGLSSVSPYDHRLSLAPPL